MTVLNHHPAGILALDKPPGVLSHPNRDEDLPRALLAAPYDPARECYRLPGGSEIHLIHRLDSPTSGVILLATDANLAADLRLRFLSREVRKTYLALVFGVPRRRQETWQDRLKITRSGDQLRTQAGHQGETAAADMRLLQTFTGTPILSLIELAPHTGRTHQLRVQCQKRRLPIVGDTTYGDFAKNRAFTKATGCSELFLHSAQISLPVRTRGGGFTFSAESPAPGRFYTPR